MNTEELAFVNRQLAGMLKSGIPLEAGLKKMTESMSIGRLKDQLGQLGDRLEKGQPVEQAVEGLDLSDTYKRLLVLGQESQSMPKVLSCVADYYERLHLALGTAGVNGSCVAETCGDVLAGLRDDPVEEVRDRSASP